MGKNVGKKISKILSGKYNKNLFEHPKQSATDALKTTSKRAIQKTAEATGDSIGNKVADRITKASKTSSRNNSEENIEHDREIHRERYISPEKGKKNIDDLRLI